MYLDNHDHAREEKYKGEAKSIEKLSRNSRNIAEIHHYTLAPSPRLPLKQDAQRDWWKCQQIAGKTENWQGI